MHVSEMRLKEACSVTNVSSYLRGNVTIAAGDYRKTKKCANLQRKFKNGWIDRGGNSGEQ
jgi:hypothetical protein